MADSKKGFMTPEIILATIALATGSFMNILDMTIVNTAVSHIAGDFAVPYSQGTWVITSYAVSEAIFLPLTGWLTSRFGILRQYIVATLLFTIASIGCGLAPNFETLLFARILQGIVGASMIPLSQTLLVSIYPPEKRGMAIGIWAMTAVTAPVVGPILGGYITDTLTWRWAFYINLPIGILSSLIVYIIFKGRGWVDTIKKVPIDYFGFICLAISIGALQILLDKGNELDWFESNFVCILAILFIVFLVILLIWESHQEHPVVNLSFFKDRNYTVGVIVLCLGSIAFFSTVVILPIWLQNYMGYTAYMSGLTTATTSIFVIFLAPIIGTNIHKVDPRKVVMFGFIVFFVVSYFGAHLTPDVTPGYIAFNRMLLGIGLACFFLPLNTIMLSNISNEQMASASGLSNFTRNMGNSFGTSLVVNYWDRFQSSHHNTLVGSVQIGNPNFNDYGAGLNIPTQEKLALIDHTINSQAAIMGINNIMLLSGFIMLCLIPLVFLASRPKKIVIVSE